MQISAWGVMIVEYSEGATLRSAIQDTFSGERPCDMCISLSKTPIEKPDLTVSQGLLLKNLQLFLLKEEESLKYNASSTFIQFVGKYFSISKVFRDLDPPPPKFG